MECTHLPNLRAFSQPLENSGSSIETVALQVYEILKIDHEFLQFF